MNRTETHSVRFHAHVRKLLETRCREAWESGEEFDPAKTPVKLVRSLDEWLCRSGKSDDQGGSRALAFWREFCERGRAVYYVSDGGYSRLCVDMWAERREAPILGLDRGLSLPFALERWDSLG